MSSSSTVTIDVVADTTSAVTSINKLSQSIGKTLAAAATVAASAIAAIGEQSLEAYSDYEQLADGISIIFGDYADELLENANNAYATAQVSANSYLESVSDFGMLLINSLDGDTEAAVDYVEMALNDMADISNAFGLELEEVSDVYKSLSRGIYRTLDNLQLGYAGTKSGLEALIEDANEYAETIGMTGDLTADSYADIIQAIDLIIQKQGLAGISAYEATETLQGSMNVLSAVWENWLLGLADEDMDLSQLTSNLITALENVAKNALPRIQQIADGLVSSLPQLLSDAWDTVVPLVEEAFVGIYNVISEFVEKWTGIDLGTIDVSGLESAIDSVGEAFGELWDIVEPVVAWFVDTAVPALAGSGFGDVLSSFGDVATDMWDALEPALTWLVEDILPSLSDLITDVFSTIDLEATIEGVGRSLDSLSTAAEPAVDVLENLGDTFDIFTGEFISTDTVDAAQDLADALSTMDASEVEALDDALAVLDSTGLESIVDALDIMDTTELETLGDALSTMDSSELEELSATLASMDTTSLDSVSASLDSLEFESVVEACQLLYDSFGEDTESAQTLVDVLSAMDSTELDSLSETLSTMDASELESLSVTLDGLEFDSITEACDLLYDSLDNDTGGAEELSTALGSLEMPSLSLENSLDLGSAISSITEFVGSVFSALGALIIEYAPSLLSSVSDLLWELEEWVSENLPTIISNALTFLTTLGDILWEYLPSILGAIGIIIGEVLAYITEQIPEILTLIGGAISGIVDIFLDLGISILVGFIEGVLQAYDDVVENIKTIFNNIIDFVKGIFGIASPSTVFSDIGDNLIAGLIEGIQGAFESVTTVFSDLKDSVAEFFSDAVDWLFDSGSNLLQGLIDGVSNMASSAVETVTGVASNIIGGVKDFFGVASPSTVFADIGENLMSGLQNGIDSGSGDADSEAAAAAEALTNTMTTAISALSSSMSTMTSSMMTTMSTTIKTMTSSIGSSWNTAWNSVSSSMSTVWAGMITTLTSSTKSMLSAVKSIKSSITGCFSDASSWLSSAGTNIISGLTNSIKKGLSSVTSTIKNLCTSAISAAKSALGIASPSKVFAEIGDYLMEGLANGVDESADEAISAVEGVADKLATTIDTGALDIGVTYNAIADLQTVGTDALAATKGYTVNQTFETKVVRADSDLYTAAPILYRSAMRTAALA